MRQSTPLNLNLTKTKKDSVSHKKLDLFHQVVKLTKQNQFLQTKVNCLYAELTSMSALKQKYKKKYKDLKSSHNFMNSGHIQYFSTEKNCGKMKNMRTTTEIQQSKTLQEIQFPYSHTQNTQGTDIGRIMMSLTKIDLAISGLNEKVASINRMTQPQRYQQIWCRITQLSQNINSLAAKFQNKQLEGSHRHQYGLQQLNTHIPVKEKKYAEMEGDHRADRFRLIQSIEKRQFESEVKKQGRARRQRIASENSAKKGQQWKLLQEIGRQLQNWKFSISEASEKITKP